MNTLTNELNLIKGGKCMITKNTLWCNEVIEKEIILKAKLDKAQAEHDYEAIMCIKNDIANLYGIPKPYSQDSFDDL